MLEAGKAGVVLGTSGKTSINSRSVLVLGEVCIESASFVSRTLLFLIFRGSSALIVVGDASAGVFCTGGMDSLVLGIGLCKKLSNITFDCKVVVGTIFTMKSRFNCTRKRTEIAIANNAENRRCRLDRGKKT